MGEPLKAGDHALITAALIERAGGYIRITREEVEAMQKKADRTSYTEQYNRLGDCYELIRRQEEPN